MIMYMLAVFTGTVAVITFLCAWYIERKLGSMATMFITREAYQWVRVAQIFTILCIAFLIYVYVTEG